MAHLSTAEPIRAPRAEVRAACWFALAVLVVSALGGVVWALLAPTERVVVVEPGRGAALTGESAHRFDALAIFVCIGVVVGLVSAAAMWRLRRFRGPLLQGALLFGSLVGAWLMSLCGELLAGALHTRPAKPAVHTIVEFAPTVDGWTALLVQPLVASLVVLILSALSTAEDLGTGRAAPETPGGARPYASDVTYGPYGAPIPHGSAPTVGRTGPFQDADFR
ncbi:DUF2567 domain-containing protein [Nocardia sp. CDC159]|uniref:DUF2567 domain-containing protein n=1 Tax=Nocardia pulmonis TaxID=2951408 RepID=A0A9X2IUV6_9NOCA|nr:MULTISPECIES: DUF2567 domain-containing protein [Nocardia]MCM6773257.1 DUF2567 domain-containing protein [Nocardia pulmonis]MCM6786144.1 DUF2567 domain-containing protein [Nocardia sp. CDC159]